MAGGGNEGAQKNNAEDDDVDDEDGDELIGPVPPSQTAAGSGAVPEKKSKLV